MPYTGTKKNRSRGTSNSSTLNPNSRNVSSKYFFKKPEEEHKSVSPYKNCLTELKSFEIIDSMDDFKTPKAVKVSKITQKQSKVTKKKQKVSKQPKLRQFIENNFKNVDVNPEHLQMALALSNSSYEAENPGEPVNKMELFPDGKTVAFKKALEQFGFQCGKKSKLEPQISKKALDLPKSKKSRYKYVTPILYIRTTEDRESLIASKTSLILTKNFQKKTEKNSSDPDFKLYSQTLIKHQKNSIFNLNNLELTQLNTETHRFQAKNLAIDISSVKQSGILLKHWRHIPGRDVSPIKRSIVINEQTKLQENLNESEGGKNSLESPRKMRRNRSVSPDLFSSDDDCDSDLVKRAFSSEDLSKSTAGSSDNGEKSDFKFKNFENNSQKDDKNDLFQTKQGQNKQIYDLTDLVDDSNSDSGRKSDKSAFYDSSKTLLYSHTDSVIKTSHSDSFELNSAENSSKNTDFNVTEHILDVLNNASTYSYMNYSENEPFSAEKSKNSPPLSEQNHENMNLSQDNSSQESICVISDDELNYSSTYYTPQKHVNNDLFNINDAYDDKEPLSPPISNKTDLITQTNGTNVKNSPNKSTPDNKFVVKTKNITPMLDYDALNTPKINSELDKFGLKPLKRQRGVELLRYIYDTTHPLVEGITIDSSDQDNKVVKKRKTNSPKKNCNKIIEFTNEKQKDVDIVGDIVREDELDELIFEKLQSKRILSCRIPLQIVWHNFVSSNPKIMENILLYEPLQLEVLYAMLKEQGFKFNVQDLLTFLDKKCITIRTSQGGQNKRGFSQ